MNKIISFVSLVGLFFIAGCKLEVQRVESKVYYAEYGQKSGPLTLPGDLKPALTEKIELILEDGQFDEISIQSPQDEFESLVSTDGKIHLILSFSAQDQAMIDEFKKPIEKQWHNQIQQGKKSISIQLNSSSSYVCGINIDVVDGQEKRWVSGICIHDVKIALPKKSKTKVFYNSIPGTGIGSVSVEELPTILTKAVDSDFHRVGLVKKFARSYGKAVTMNEVASILDVIDSDFHKKQALQMFSKKFSDPQNMAVIIRSFESDFHKVGAIEIIVQSVGKDSRFLNIAQVLDVLGNIASDFHKSNACEHFAGHIVDRENAVQVMDAISSSFYKEDAVKELKK